MAYALNGMTHIFASDSSFCHAGSELCVPTWCVKYNKITFYAFGLYTDFEVCKKKKKKNKKNVLSI